MRLYFERCSTSLIRAGSAGRPVKASGFRRRRDGTMEISLRPFQIVTFKVSLRIAKNKSSELK